MNSGKVVVVTGAGSGFGRLIAETLARNGHRVFATMRVVKTRNVQAAGEIETLARREGLALHVLEIDVTD